MKHIALLASAALLHSVCSTADARPVQAEPPSFEPLRTIHVSPFGNDSADGLSLEQALRSISAAAKITRPGDLVLVKGGIYNENIHLSVPGTAENPIVFRAAPGETPLINGGFRPQAWSRVQGAKNAFLAECPVYPNFVMDERDLVRYFAAPNMRVLEEHPGAFIYDSKAKTITVHPMRSLTPEQTGLTVVGFGAYSGIGEVSARGYASEKGFWPRAPYNRIEGFHIAFQPIGVQLRADNTEAWNNTVYGCIAGMQIYSDTKDSVLANNTVFGNDRNGIWIGSALRGVLRGNLSYSNSPRGPSMYSGSSGHPHQLAVYGKVDSPVFIGNVAVGKRDGLERGARVTRFKSAHGTVVAHRNVFVGGSVYLGWGEYAEHTGNTVVGGALRIYGGGLATPEEAAKRGSTVNGNLLLSKPDDSWFVDPERFDYRLPAGSPKLGAGAWPEASPIFFVSPKGSDSASGGAPGTAWRTIAKAVAAAVPGTTVYVMPGEYRESLEITAKGMRGQPVELLTHGRGRVVLTGDGTATHGIRIAKAANIIVDGFIFREFTESGIKASDGKSIKLGNNVFDGLPAGIILENGSGYVVENNTFTRCGESVVAAKIGETLVLRNNLFASNGGAPALSDPATRRALVSERNVFAGEKSAAQLAGWTSATKEGHPSFVFDVDVKAPDYSLPAFSPLSFAGLGKTYIGARGEMAERDPELPVEDFRLVYAAPDRVVVEWRTPGDYANSTVTLEDGIGKPRRFTRNQFLYSTELRQTRVAQTLDNLEPNKEYTVKLAVRTPAGRSNEAELKIKTPAAMRPPTTLYVSANGSDANDGGSRGNSFGTLVHAARSASPGDTILVGEGVYSEMVEVLCGGLDKERRLLIKSEKPGKAVVDLGEFWPTAFSLKGIQHVTLDGFRLRGSVYSSMRRAIHLENVSDIEIRNCVFEGRPRGAPGVVCNHIAGTNIEGLHIHNNIFKYGFYGVSVGGAEDLVIERNTFYKGGVTALSLSCKNDARMRITDNIFFDVIVPAKINPAIMIRRPTDNLTLARNIYYRENARNMGLLGFALTREGTRNAEKDRAMSVEEVSERFGVGQGDLVADPGFLNPAKGDFRLKPDSPAIGAAGDGGNIGSHPHR